jgi:hypothetical protein
MSQVEVVFAECGAFLEFVAGGYIWSLEPMNVSALSKRVFGRCTMSFGSVQISKGNQKRKVFLCGLETH